MTKWIAAFLLAGNLAFAGERKDNLNETFVTAYLQTFPGLLSSQNHDSVCERSSGAACPLNSPILSLAQIDGALEALSSSSSPVAFREIIPVAVIEPFVGDVSWQPGICRVLRLYSQRNLSLILSFGGPLPGWMGAPSGTGWGALTTRQVDVVAARLGGVVNRLLNTCGLSPQWIQNRLTIEPNNEEVATLGGAVVAAVFDSRVQNSLRAANRFSNVVSSSYVANGLDSDAVVAFYKSYYLAGGVGAPNIHMYPLVVPLDEPLADGRSLVPTETSDATIARFRSIVSGLTSGVAGGLPGRERFEVLVSEVGVSEHGRSSAPPLFRNTNIETWATDPILLSARRHFLWRVFRWGVPNSINNLYDYEVSIGYVYVGADGSWQGADPAFQSRFLSRAPSPAPIHDPGEQNVLQSFERSGLSLSAGQSIEVPPYRLVMQFDGNLVLYAGYVALWSVYSHERVSAVPACDVQLCRVVFQGDGNLVLYQGNSPYWSSVTGLVGDTLRIGRGPPYLSIHGRAGQPEWHGTVRSADTSGAGIGAGGLTLAPGQALSFGGVRLDYQWDGNFVLRDAATQVVLWSVFASEVVSFAPDCNATSCVARFDSQGRLQVSAGGSVYWSSGTSGVGLSLRIDARSKYLFIVDAGGGVRWSAPGVR